MEEILRLECFKGCQALYQGVEDFSQQDYELEHCPAQYWPRGALHTNSLWTFTLHYLCAGTHPKIWHDMTLCVKFSIWMLFRESVVKFQWLFSFVVRGFEMFDTFHGWRSRHIPQNHRLPPLPSTSSSKIDSPLGVPALAHPPDELSNMPSPVPWVLTTFGAAQPPKFPFPFSWWFSPTEGSRLVSLHIYSRKKNTRLLGIAPELLGFQVTPTIERSRLQGAWNDSFMNSSSMPLGMLSALTKSRTTWRFPISSPETAPESTVGSNFPHFSKMAPKTWGMSIHIWANLHTKMSLRNGQLSFETRRRRFWTCHFGP